MQIILTNTIVTPRCNDAESHNSPYSIILSAINMSVKSIKKREYLLEFEAKCEKPLNSESGTWDESVREKNGGKKSRCIVPLITKNTSI
jgi:hypothetical protein